MIFQHTWELVLAGKKTHDRRLCKSGEYDAVGGVGTHNKVAIKWAVGKTYAVQPGRGKKAVGRIRLTGIRQEHVQDITEADAIAEGCEPISEYVGMRSTGPNGYWKMSAREVYEELWDTIHTKPGTRWADSPLVWVLEFELVKEA